MRLAGDARRACLAVVLCGPKLKKERPRHEENMEHHGRKTLERDRILKMEGEISRRNENTAEHFQLESYRIVSGNYATQTEATASSTWSSSTIMNAGGTHDDGMVTSNGYLISPRKIDNKSDSKEEEVGPGPAPSPCKTLSPTGLPSVITAFITPFTFPIYKYLLTKHG